jgi:hypothetical protein
MTTNDNQEEQLSSSSSAGRIGFNKLRQARAQTQVALAERLQIPQGAVSRMERRQDLLLSTLREYVGALGGRLELHAVFPDAEFEIETMHPLTPRKRRGGRAAGIVPQAMSPQELVPEIGSQLGPEMSGEMLGSESGLEVHGQI